MGRPPCCDKSNVKRGLWTAEEDAKILAYVANHGTGNWTSVPKRAGLKRCGKSCRLRYTNYLRPDIKRESFTPQEEEIIISLHATIGSRWSVIAQRLPGRTDNDVKNYWNTKLKKKLFQKGIDPITHRPISHILQSLGGLSTPIPTTTTSSLPRHRSNHGNKGSDGGGGGGGGGPRMISCLNRDLKSIFSSRGSDLLSASATAAATSTSPPAYDLLTQLHAIQLVTGIANNAAADPPPSCGAPQEDTNPGELNWSDFLVDDVVLCLHEDGDGAREEEEEESGRQQAVVEEETSVFSGVGGEEGPGTELRWEFPELLVDEGFEFGDVFDV